MASVATAEVASADVGMAADNVATACIGVADASGMPAADHVGMAAAHVIRVAADAGVTSHVGATAMEAADDTTAGEATPVVPAPMKTTATPTAVESAAATGMPAAATGMPTPAATTGERNAGQDRERKRRHEQKNPRLGAHADHRSYLP